MAEQDNTQFSERDEQQIDLLVDNELSRENQRELFDRLEEVPGGWRRCALAFLEARAWKSDLSGAANPKSDTTNHAPTASADLELTQNANKSNMNYRWWTLAAMALLSFTLGIASGRQYFQSNPTPSIGGSDHAPEIAQQALPKPEEPEQSTVKWYEMEVPGNQNNPTFSVPVVEGLAPEVAQQWLSQGQQQTSLPAELRRQLEREGHRVIEERGLVPVSVGDGREVWLPYYEVEIQPGSARGFQ